MRRRLRPHVYNLMVKISRNMHSAVFYAYAPEWNKLQPQNIKLNRKLNVWWNMKNFQSFTDQLASLQQEIGRPVKWNLTVWSMYVVVLLHPTFTVFFIVFALMPEKVSLIAIYIEWMCNIVNKTWKYFKGCPKLMEVIKFARVSIL